MRYSLRFPACGNLMLALIHRFRRLSLACSQKPAARNQKRAFAQS